MEQDKKVSFVVPVYKTEKFLEKSLRSLLDNDYKNIEIVVVMDGDSAEAESIANRLKNEDQRIVKVLTITHGGACKARNAGFEYTSGDYVSFWDSDCYAEHGMIRMWVQTFKEEKVDFVYSGYRFTDDSKTFYASEAFNEYLLTCGNYISSVFPLKRELFPGWDESLLSLQDWDYWMRVVKAGGKGYWIEGAGFDTEPPGDRETISLVGCKKENWIDRLNAVRKKHNIVGRTVCFTSVAHKFRSLQLAKWFNADHKDNPAYLPHEYKAVYNIGFYPESALESANSFKDCPEGCAKIFHFTGIDVEAIRYQPWIMVRELMRILKDGKFTCIAEDEQTAKLLEELGVESEIMSLPMDFEDVPMPKEFKVYMECDRGTAEVMRQFRESCPDIPIEMGSALDMGQFACYVSFTQSEFAGENLKRFGAAGRYLMTNYKVPYSGYIEPDLEGMIKQLRKIKADFVSGVKPSSDQVAHWQGIIGPERMVKFLEKYKA